MGIETKVKAGFEKNKIKLIAGGVIALFILLFCCFASFIIIGLFRGIGSKNVVSEQRGVDVFTQINLEGQGKIIIEQSNEFSLKVEAEDNIIDRVETKVKDGTLYIKTKRSFPYFNNFLFPRKDINIYVYVKDIDEVRISGSGSVVTEGQLVVDSFTLTVNGAGKSDMNIKAFEVVTSVSGSATVTYTGEAKSQSIISSGSIDYLGDQFVTEETSIEISGSGNTTVNAQKSLKVKISGAGNVKYTGDPKITQEVSGSGKVEKITE